MLPKLKLTTAERMYLWRKRKGLDQPEAAACHGMTVSAWREIVITSYSIHYTKLYESCSPCGLHIL